MDIFVNIGNHKLKVNPYSITRSISEELNSKLDDAIMKTLFKEFAPLPNESREAYDARYKAWQESKKKAAKAAKEEEVPVKKGKKTTAVAEETPVEEEVAGESLRDYVRKQLNLTKYEDQLDYLYDVTCAIAEVFGQSQKADRKALNDTPLIDINNFCFKVCKYAKIPIGLTEEVLDYDDFS